MNTEVLRALLGGSLIGLSASLLLLLNGRIAGISGILERAMRRPKGDSHWRLFFLAGLLVGGGLIAGLTPELLVNGTSMSPPRLIVAGILVGFGTLLGSGCTSGHGVCGISRFSPRSLLATFIFMGFGMITVALLRAFLGAAA